MDRNFEQEAQKQGWKPKEDFLKGGGSESDWVDAQKFVERGEQSAPILKSKLEKNERRVAQLEDTVHSLTRHHNRMLDQEKARNERLIAELEDARAKAVEDGNAKAFKSADQQINKLKEQAAQQAKMPERNQVDPEVEAWLHDNPWYSENPALQAMADGYSEKLKAANPGLHGRAFLDKITTFVTEHEKSKAPKEEPKRPVIDDEDDRTPTPKRTTSAKKGYDDLPKSDRRECDRLIKEIPGFTKEEFLKYYDWE